MYSESAAYEDLRLIEVGVESCSNGMYACCERGWAAVEMHVVVELCWL